ncbi:MAG: hypothetical protein HY579_09155 [Nitrospinae bacterium]|nr:hypothetical protein [Nitrospinota bacterium]
MKLSKDVIIPVEKIVHYLLTPRAWDDKSQFLVQAGFSQDNPDVLKRDLAALAETSEAAEDGVNEYGEFLRTDGVLTGPNGRKLPVTAIWLRWRSDGSVHFVTLKPRKEKRS